MSSVPLSTDFFSSAMRVDRSFQPAINGVRTILSAIKRARPVAAPMARRRCRFLICTRPSFSPLEVQRKLKRSLAANLVHLHFADFLRGPQLVEHLEKRLVVVRHAGTRHRRQLANFNRL